MSGIMKSLFGESRSSADASPPKHPSTTRAVASPVIVSSTYAEAKAAAAQVAILLVLDGGKDDWAALFQGLTLTDGRAIRVVQVRL
jgi:hypothetical protein